VLEAALYHRHRYLPDFIAAEKAGRALPDILPNPRDVIVTSQGLKIVGPIDAEQQQVMLAAVKLRDLALKTLADIRITSANERAGAARSPKLSTAQNLPFEPDHTASSKKAHSTARR
jgi:hypothetical protein